VPEGFPIQPPPPFPAKPSRCLIMLYSILANAVLVIHGLFIVFVVLGGALALRWRWMAWIHVPVAMYGIAIEWIGWICPLTPLENHLRRRAGEQGYEGGFIEHHLLPLIYPADYTVSLQIVLGAVVLVVNIVIYALVFVRHRRG
jgi:hypothetical protein